MARRADGIPQGIKDTRQGIVDTRSAMTEKLEILEERVRETVEEAQSSVEEMVEKVRYTVDTTVETMKQTIEGAQSSVEDIAENVKGTVGETVETVQRIFDLHHQMEQHPWLLLSGSLLVGYLLGSGGNGRTSAAGSAYDPRFSLASPTPASFSESSAHPQPRPETGNGVLERFKDEIAIIEGEAVRAVVSTLWGMVKQALLPPPTPPLTSTRTKQGSQSSDHPAQLWGRCS